jgi:hypothetical protein
VRSFCCPEVSEEELKVGQMQGKFQMQVLPAMGLTVRRTA